MLYSLGSKNIIIIIIYINNILIYINKELRRVLKRYIESLLVDIRG